MTFRSLAVALWMILQVWPVHAQPAVGAIVGSVVDLGVRTVPLPQGRWTVVSVQNDYSDKNSPLIRVYLAELDKGVLSRWIYLATNIEYSKNGWNRNKSICDRRNVHFNYSDSSHNSNDTECWIVNHWGMTMGEDASQAAVDFYRWSDMKGRPNTAVGVAYYFAKHGDFLTLELMYNPVLDGFPDTPSGEWRGNPWHADIASKDPRRISYLRALKAMGEMYFQQLQNVLH